MIRCLDSIILGLALLSDLDAIQVVFSNSLYSIWLISI